jgi:hypothetical protein
VASGLTAVTAPDPLSVRWIAAGLAVLAVVTTVAITTRRAAPLATGSTFPPEAFSRRADGRSADTS